ncbi:MAG: hypothetical protein ACRCTZ_14265 [Sarcina sp.]
MKKSKQKSRRFKRYIRKQLNKAKKDIANLNLEPSTYHWDERYRDCHNSPNLGPHYSEIGNHRSPIVHHHNPHQLSSEVQGLTWADIKVFDKEDSGIRIEKKM